MINKHNTILAFLFLFITGIFIVPMMSSCGKGAAASSIGLNTQLQILNLSPDVHPVDLYIDFIKQNVNSYFYPSASGYFYLKSIDTPIQIRSALMTTTNLLSIDYVFKANHKYSLFVTGLNVSKGVVGIVTADDTVAVPSVGFGKIRFVNASVLSPTLDVLANGTTAFSGVIYKQVTDYVQLPAGNYNFQLSPSGSPGTILSTNLPATTTIQDGRLYTIYTYGETGHTDSAAFGAGVLTNR